MPVFIRMDFNCIHSRLSLSGYPSSSFPWHCPRFSDRHRLYEVRWLVDRSLKTNSFGSALSKLNERDEMRLFFSSSIEKLTEIVGAIERVHIRRGMDFEVVHGVTLDVSPIDSDESVSYTHLTLPTKRIV